MLIDASALCYQQFCKSCLHLVIVLKSVVTKNFYQWWKHMIMASFQIRAVCGMFKDFPGAVELMFHSVAEHHHAEAEHLC